MRKKILTLMGLIITGLLVSPLFLISCGSSDSSSGQLTTGSGDFSTVGVSASSTTAASSGDRQAAEAYFTAMAPAIEKDYQGSLKVEQAQSEWSKKYANSDPYTDWAGWDDISAVFRELLPLSQELTASYEVVTPPEVFRKAHADLLELNRQGNAWAQTMVDNIESRRPVVEWFGEFQAGPNGPPSSQVLTEFREAAAQVGIELPAKLITVYSK